jgi:DNA-binding transcriptional LysR family regulator
MLHWDNLRIVLAVKRGGSMHAAAEALGVDRATILRRLDALEAQLGARLFERRREGCVLTRAGLGIIGTIEGVADALTALENRVGGEDQRPEGAVCLAIPEFFAVKLLAPAITRFQAAYPGITLEVRTGHGFLNLARGEADIALRNRRPDHNSLVSRRVGVGAMALFAARRYLDAHGAPENGNLAGHQLLLFDDSLVGFPGSQWVEERTKEAHVAMRSNEIMPLLAAARAGVGIAFLPVMAAHGEPDLASVAPGILARLDLILVTHRDLRRRARVRAVFDFIVRLCVENAAAISGASIAEAFGDRHTLAGVSERQRNPAAPSRDHPGSSRV